METRKLQLAEIQPNRGQIEGLPKNPRKWDKKELERLKRSIEETPELMEARGLIVIKNAGKYVVLSGNMRYAAVKALGWKDATAHILPEDTPLKVQREIVMKDNQTFGDWDYDELANGWGDMPLPDWGVKAWVAPQERSAETQQGPTGPTGGPGDPGTTGGVEEPELGRIIIVYQREDEPTVAEMLGVEHVDKIVYSINELGGKE